MIYNLPILSEEFVNNVLQVYNEKNFVDGKISNDSNIKNNLMLPNGYDKSYASRILISGLHQSKFQGNFLVKKVSEPQFLWYKTGMYYGYHIDEWPITGVNSHYSMTISLSDPDEYEGGELVLKIGNVETEHKIKKGEGVLYSTGLWHKVNPVTSGERKVATVWIESFVNNSAMRENLTQLTMILKDNQDNIDYEIFEKLEQVRVNMMREHADNI